MFLPSKTRHLRFEAAVQTAASLLVAITLASSPQPCRGSAETDHGPDAETQKFINSLPARTLQFPSKLSLGAVYEVKYHGSCPRERGTIFGDAKGAVKVPAKTAIMLKVNYEASGDLSRLNTLKPADLQKLELMSTRIDDDSLKHVARLTGLTGLNVVDTDITDRALTPLTGLKNLIWLDVSRTNITEQSLTSICKMTGLKCLDMHNNNVRPSPLWHELRNLHQLQEIGLSTTRVDDTVISDIVALPNLRVLELSTTKVTDKSVKLIAAKCPHLIRLSLSNDKITDACLKDLLSLKELSYLHVAQTKLSPTAVEALRKKLGRGLQAQRSTTPLIHMYHDLFGN